MSATPLAAVIAARIRARGPIGVAEFMALALGDPDHGYYMRRDPLGAAGDFVTAPEISAVFGELIGLWVVAVWEAMERPAPCALVELGPGRGTLMADAWRAIAAAAPACAAALGLHLVERSPVLRARAEQALASVRDRCVWHRHIDDVPRAPLIVIANELFDALPIEQYVRVDGGWARRMVGIDDDALGFVLGPAPGFEIPEAFGPVVEGDVVEICGEGEDLVRTIAGRLGCDGGAALIIDYGHARSAAGETLQAVRGHRFADVLAAPGEVDLSHHVDFAALARAARATGASTLGPIPQGLFLGRLGAGERAEALAAAQSVRADAVLGAVRRLLHPGRMGLLFKVLAITDPRLPAPPGFAARNR